MARGLQDADFDVIAVEPGIGGALAARQRGVEWVICGTVQDVGFAKSSLPAVGLFDVLEHIADDRSELSCAALHLGAGGNLVVLAPAHQFLFSPFDANIGRYRRYCRASLIALNPPGCRLGHCFMLDTAGFFGSLANRVLLRASMPTAAQIALWDEVLVPISLILDRLTGYNLGKSVVAVWTRSSRTGV